jgi:hypothetical protein
MCTYILPHTDVFPDHLRDLYRHWSPASERFTGCDALFAALQHGCGVTRTVFCRTFWFSGHRHTQVFYFQLICESEMKRMAVIQSPHVERFIAAAKLEVFYVSEQVREDKALAAVAAV